MIYYDRIDVSERIDLDKASASRKCDLSHYWYFLNYNCSQMSVIDVMTY